MDYNRIVNCCWNMSVNEDREKVKNQIEKWLLDEGYKVKSVTNKNAYFNFFAEDPYGREVSVSQPIKKADQIKLVAGVRLSQEQLNKLSQMSEDKRNEILWKLRFGLLDRGVGFSLITMPLRSIKIWSVLFYDGLTKDHFFNRLFKVSNALVFIFWTIARELGEREPTTEFKHIV